MFCFSAEWKSPHNFPSTLNMNAGIVLCCPLYFFFILLFCSRISRMFTTLRSLLLWKRNTNIFPYWQLSRKGSSKIYINRMQKAREENKKIKQNKTEWSQRYAYKQMKYRNAAWLRALLMCVRAYRTEYICNDETAMVEILPKSLAKLCAFYFLFILFSSLEFRFRLLLLFYGKDTFDAFGVRFACVSRRNAHIYTSHSKQCRTFFRWLFLFFSILFTLLALWLLLLRTQIQYIILI